MLIRRMVCPEQFGTESGFTMDPQFAEGLDDFEFNTRGPFDPSVDIVNYQGPASFDNAYVAPHYDHARIYVVNKSWRLWEPARNARSASANVANEMGSALRPQLTEDQGGEQVEFHPPNIPSQGALIHGVKGELEFRFTDSPFRTIFDSDPTDVREQFGFWVGEDEQALFGGWPGNNLPWPVAPEDRTWWRPFHAAAVSAEGLPLRFDNTRLFMARVPVFVAMYKGTVKPSNLTLEEADDPNVSRMSIDSGPYDDPSTTIGMDITNPDVLESRRIVWWDKFDAWLPVPVVPNPEGHPNAPLPSQLGATVKYPLNLDRNWRVKKDQVLWLHVQTGTVRVPLVVAGDPVPWSHQWATYHGHPFTVALHASMLVSRV